MRGDVWGRTAGGGSDRAARYEPESEGASVKRALMTWGGWLGHEPDQCVHLFAPFLRAQGYDVTISTTLDTYLDEEFMRALDLIVPVWTMSSITDAQVQGLLGAVASGVGIAGWHGGM